MLCCSFRLFLFFAHACSSSCGLFLGGNQNGRALTATYSHIGSGAHGEPPAVPSITPSNVARQRETQENSNSSRERPRKGWSFRSKTCKICIEPAVLVIHFMYQKPKSVPRVKSVSVTRYQAYGTLPVHRGTGYRLGQKYKVRIGANMDMKRSFHFCPERYTMFSHCNSSVPRNPACCGQ